MAVDEKSKVSPWSAVFDTLYRSLGEWVNRDKIAAAARDVLVAMGYEDDLYLVHDTGEMPGPDAPLRKAIQDLLGFAPEFGWTPEVAELVAESDWADSDDVDEQLRALNDREAWRAEKGGREAYEVVELRSGRSIKRRTVPDTGPVPLLSEPLYYPLINHKDNARTLRARINEVRRLAGLESER